MKMDKYLHFPEPLFHAYLDEELSPNERSAFEEHYETCPDCRAEVQSLSDLFQRIDALPQVEIGRNLSSAILSLIDSRRVSTRRWWRALAFQAITSVLLIWMVWPMVEPYALAAQEVDWESTLIEFEMVFSDHFASLSRAAVPLIEQTASQLTLRMKLAEFELTERYLVPLLFSATLLWVAGNRILLAGRKPNR